jgi:hypothetical protein
VNSLQLPQNISGANYPVSNDYGSQSEGTIQLSGNGVYLTMMGLGLNAATFNVNPLLFCPPGYSDPPGYSFSTCDPENGNPAMAQTGSLTGQTYSGNIPVPRVAVLIDANGNVNSSTVLYNIFNQNDPRGAYTTGTFTAGQLPIYVSGQGCKTWDPSDNLCDGGSTSPYDDTSGVYLTTLGANNFNASNNPTAITGPDNGPGNGGSENCPSSTYPTCTSADDARMVQIYNNTLYVSMDDKPGSSTLGYNRAYIGTLGDPAATSLYTCTGVGGGCPTGDGPYGPSILAGLGNTGGTGKYTLNTAGAGNTSNGNNLNVGLKINLSPQNFFFASPTVLYVADTGFPKNNSNGPDTVCTNDGGKSSATVGDGGLQKWILNPIVTAGVVNTGSTSAKETVTASSGAFTQGEVGLTITDSAGYIPAGTTITAVSSAGANATMSAAATGTDANDIITVQGWSLAYTLYNGLNLVLNSDCDPNSPTAAGSQNAATGLYGLAGVVNNGVATLYVTTYASNDLVVTYLYGITDTLATTTMTSPGTTFTLLDTAPAGSLFRGVSLAPTIPAGNVEVTAVASGVPAGLNVTTANTGCSPSTFITPVTQTWTPGSSCTLSVASPQAASGQQYVFSQWQGTNGTTNPTTATAPSTTATYTASFTAQPSAIYSPASPSTLTGTSATFQWGGYSGATAFWLDVGKEAKGDEYYQSGSLSNTTFSQTVNSLPTDGSTVVATWYYLLNGTWVPNSYSYTASGSGAAAITSPASNSTLPGSTVTFQWNTVANANAYWLDVGKEADGDEYYQSGSLTPVSETAGSAQSVTVNGLPTDGSTVVATLYTQFSSGGPWKSNPFTYTALNSNNALATMTTPLPGNLTGCCYTFQWTPGTNVTAYWLDVGMEAKGDEYYQSGSLSTTSTQVNSLPGGGATVYATLYSYIGGTWYYNVYEYTSN